MTTLARPALSRGLLILLGIAAAVVSVAGLKDISEIVAPAFLALVLVIFVHPIQGWLERWHLPMWLSVVATIVAAYAIVVVMTLTLLVAVAHFALLVPTYQDDASSMVEDFGSWLQSLGVSKDQVKTLLSSVDLGKVTSLITSLLSQTLAVLSNLFFLVTMLLFLCADASWFPRRLAAAREQRSQVVDALESFAHGTRSYLVVSTVFGLIVAVIDTLLLWALDIPEPLLWGLLAFITNYVPNIGFVLGLIPPAVLALFEGGWDKFLVVVVAYSVINVVIQTFIQPKVVGDVVGLSTSLTFLSLVFWTWVLGPLGAILAIPLSLLLKAMLVDVDPANRWLVPLLSGEDPPPRPTAEEAPA